MVDEVKENPLSVVNNEPWYKEGLRFNCTGCGDCCRGPGYVWVKEEEIKRLAKQLNMSVEAFMKKYTRQVGFNISLTEDPVTDDCIFLKDGKECSVYEARPHQCRSFPWWPENIDTPEKWAETKKRCEGIDHPDAPLIPASEIKKSL